MAIQHGYDFRTARFTAVPGEHVYIVMDVVWFSGTYPRLYPAALAREMISGLRQVE